MQRKRLTEVFPWLLPLRQKQRNFMFYLGMRLDRQRYAARPGAIRYTEVLFEDQSLLINQNSGMDIQYQYNKVHNLRLASATIDGIIIEPGETFSFWQCVKNAEKLGRYKEGLSLVNGKLVHVYGGGLCQISNLLFWCFLHSPLTIIERHTHFVKAFPDPPSDIPDGVDATVSEGWKDLKVKNDTDQPIQISLKVNADYLVCTLLCAKAPCKRYEIEARKLRFFSRRQEIFEEVEIWQRITDLKSGAETEKMLYLNRTKLGYLPEGQRIEEE